MKDNPVRTKSASGRLLPLALAGLAICAIVIVAGVVATSTPQQAAAERAVPPLPTPVAKVVRQEMRDQVELTCDAATQDVKAVAPASARKFAALVVTAIGVKSGDRLQSGKLVAAVSGRPIVAFESTMPFYRDLRLGDKGVDVRALEAGLVAAKRLGAADDVFDARTASAIRAINAGAGIGDSAEFHVESAWAVPPGSTVSQVAAQVGDAVAKDTALVTGQAAEGRWACPTATNLEVQPGQQLAGKAEGRDVAVKLTGVDVDEATKAQKLLVEPTTKLESGAGLTVTVVSAASDGPVLSVPAGSVYTEPDGRTTVRRVADDKSTPIEVEVGVVAGGWAQVSGEGLAEGQQVQLRGADG